MRLDDILDKVRGYAPNADLDVIVRAYFYAARAHAGQMRKSGEEYFIHPIAVADLLAQLQMDVDTISTALLHDTMEDCLATRDELTAEFGPEITDLVDGVTKIGKLQFKNKHEAEAESFRKLVLAMAKDIRVILVKLADRLHNMRTLEHMKPDRQRAIAQETMDIYAPIANRLGLSKWKMELEDHCFQYLHPPIFERLKAELEATAEPRAAYIERVIGLLQASAAKMELKAEVTGRAKHIYSFYRKMEANQLTVEEIHDQLAFRILVDSIPECYTALGFVHGMFRPVSDRIKDYIANPKSNGYQSLHTLVFGPDGKQIEVQIRTRQMHRIAELGICAHWRYKEGHLALSKDDIDAITRLRELYEAAREVEDSQEFMETVKIDLFANEIFVYTPKGSVKFLPQGATPIDFAFSIHSEVGYHCVGARVNGRMVPLDHELKNSDTVEILTAPSQKPSRDWLEMARTGRALSRIRRAVREEERDKGRELGRELLENALKKYDLSLKELGKNNRIDPLLEDFGYQKLDQLLIAVGTGHIMVDRVLVKVLPPGTIEEEKPESAFAGFMKRFRPRKTVSPVVIQGEEDLMVSYAKCCSPLPGEVVMGYITRGRGITVHLASCPQLLATEAERRVPVQWHGQMKGEHPCELKVVCVNKPGMLADMTAVCKAAHININRVGAAPLEDNKSLVSLEVLVTNVSQLGGLMRDIEKIKGVVRVERVRASEQSA